MNEMTEHNPRIERLLVVDDEKEMLKSLNRLFRKEYEIYQAENADEALKIMNMHDIQVILSDQRMPGLTGSQFFDKLKLVHPDSIRLILTGFSDIEAVIEAINRGNIFRYITKPWNPLELKTIIREAFDRYWLSINNRKLLKELQEANHLLEERVAERTKELDLKNRNLHDLNQKMNEFLGMAVHDLRNPLGIVDVFSALILEEGINLDETQKSFLNIINSQSKFMRNLLNDILDISKIEAGKLTLNHSIGDYSEFVAENISLNAHLAAHKSIKINFNKPEKMDEFAFDRQKMTQVLNNLLSNAIKYSEAHTEITVSLEEDEEYVITRVADQGLGIPEKDIKTIFTPFSKSSVSPTADEKSTGLGLAIVKKIIEAHRGKIDVKSQIGRGTTFSFFIPKNSES